MRLPAFIMTTLATVASTTRVRAQEIVEKQICVDAFESAQALRHKGQLTAARTQLSTCSRPVCPTLVREECERWITDVSNAMPSLLVAVRDPSGRDLLTARVFIDHVAQPDALEGKPIALDPGVHSIRVDATGMTPVDERLVMREGERNRSLTVTLQPPRTASAADTEPAPEPTLRPPPILAYTLLGVGAGAFAAGVVLDLVAAADVRQLRDRCAPNCGEGEVDAAKQKYYAAIGLGAAGLAAAATGTILFFTRSQSAGYAFHLAPGRSGVELSWRARF